VNLLDLGLRPGEKARFRRRDNERWKEATIVRLERDGSIGLRDAKGASRAVPLELVEVQAEGPRGARGWEPVATRANRVEQLNLF
jgi:hypothetical protein